jgi:hypothetical protein
MEEPKEGRMKVFWWQGGIQIQPESDVEAEALNVVMNAVRYERPPESDDPRTAPTPNLGEAEGGLDVRF